jgi:hypothetical protein
MVYTSSLICCWVLNGKLAVREQGKDIRNTGIMVVKECSVLVDGNIQNFLMRHQLIYIFRDCMVAVVVLGHTGTELRMGTGSTTTRNTGRGEFDR